jgi:hypothetical protein
MLMKNTICFILLTFISLGAHAAIDGRYETACLNYSQDRFFKSEVAISGANFGGKLFLYADSNCQHLDLVVDYSSEVNYPTGLELGPIDHKVKSALMIVFNDKIRDDLNKNGSCGKSEVRIGTPIDILGLPACGPLKIPAKDAILFDMYEFKKPNISFGAFPLLWVQIEEKRPVLPSRVTFGKK